MAEMSDADQLKEEKQDVEEQADHDEKELSDEQCNLIINYLPPTLGDAELRKLFEAFGAISQVKVIKDRLSGQSLGYGFVKYEAVESAKAACATMNGHQVDNKRLKVAVARPPTRELAKTNLYISGLPLSWTKSEIDELFGPYGKILESRVLIDPATKTSRGVGFCRLDSYESAVKAIAAVHGTLPVGASTKLGVKFADPPKDARKKLMGYGPIHSALNYRFNPMASRAGIVSPFYQAPTARPLLPVSAVSAAAAAAAAAAGGVSPPMEKKEYSGICLFIYHLAPECDELTLQHLFSNYGTVLSAKVMKDLHTGRPKGFGFVNMLNEQQAKAAIAGLNGFQLGTKFLKVSLKK